jgi:hypothetical protein
MEDWVHRALERWPNVPALYGWLKLDRRGRWLIKGEPISRPQIIDVINRNYAADECGCWYFQNGPQRGYMQLERAPFIAYIDDSNAQLFTHTQLPISKIGAAYLDESGGLYLETKHGPAALLDTDLDWALSRIRTSSGDLSEAALAAALKLPSGSETELSISYRSNSLPLHRLDSKSAPDRLRFVLSPAPSRSSSEL